MKETTSAVCADTERANRLPAKDIRWILAQKPEAPPPRYQALKRSNPELVPRPGEKEDKKLMALYGVTRALYEVQERLPKLQEWVRSELKEKGYVEVDDDWFKCKAEAQALINRDWPRIRAKMDELRLMDEPCLSEGGDERESDSDEEDGEDEVALESLMKDYM
ncbi:uncharacterized protein [Miscanthus floridulus]|uniref:uncharacterized protein n=1 Tax=Miscanthus floridulus TaxID=154761 RepID=UPI003459E596